MEIKEIKIQTEDLVSVPEAARQLGKHKMTLYRWIDARKVAYIKLSGILFIPASEVERIKNDQATGGESPAA